MKKEEKIHEAIAARRAQMKESVDTLAVIRKEIVTRAQTPRVRTYGEYVQQELVLPDGPYRGHKFKTSYQPYTRLLLEEIDKNIWRAIWELGPTQSGKTLIGSAAPALYHSIELRQNVVFGTPNMDMAADKWASDLLPIIMSSGYVAELPASGRGSRGAQNLTRIDWRNGGGIRFMTGGAGDKGRAGFTSPTICITEVDGMDEAGGASDETDKVSQLIARSNAASSRARVYGESTVTTKQGRIWIEYQRGTCSRIATPCPHCGEYVTLEREHLRGWEDAESEKQADANTHWYCSACGQPWTEAERRTANETAVLVHRGQTVDKNGHVAGPVPDTFSLGFRWSAVNNLFWTAGDIGLRCWRAARAANADLAEREICQYVFATPYEPPDMSAATLDLETIEGRRAQYWQGQVPEMAEAYTLGIDIGKWQCHWVSLAGLPGGLAHVPDYGAFEVYSNEMAEEEAILAALRGFRDVIEAGWDWGGDKRVIPQAVWIDARYLRRQVVQFCNESGDRYMPCISFGQTTWGKSAQKYRQPRGLGKTILYVGEDYHFQRDGNGNGIVCQRNADTWKEWVHRRLAVNAGLPGSLTLFDTREKYRHRAFVQSLLSERQEVVFRPNKGDVLEWVVKQRRKNHKLDALALAASAAHFCGWRVVREEVDTKIKTTRQTATGNQRDSGLRRPGDRSFITGTV